MNILLSCNELYVIPTTVCITSIFENNKNVKINVYIFFSNILDEQKVILHDLANKYGQSIILVKIDERYFSGVPVLRWSKEAYYRLLINDVININSDRILYLDSDIIVNGSLQEIYNIDLKNFYVAALAESSDGIHRKRLGLSDHGDYFQTGVVLFNIVECKKILNYEHSILVIKNIGDSMLAVDQDVVNVMFDGKIKGIDIKFNNCLVTRFEDNIISRLFNIVNKKNVSETVIFHYAMSKPWNNIYSGSCEHLWYKYLKLSPYNYLYSSKYNKIKYKILRTGLFKVIFYKYIMLTPYINKIAKRLPLNWYNYLKNYYRKNIK